MPLANSISKSNKYKSHTSYLQPRSKSSEIVRALSRMPLGLLYA